MDILFLRKRSKFTPIRLAKIVITAVPLFIFLWILNQNFAFWGIHRIRISSFLHLPQSVRYVDGSEVGIVATADGTRTRPYKDQVTFAVTLPRGFDTMNMKAEVETDVFASVTLSAKAPVNALDQSVTYRTPTVYSTDWHSFHLGRGLLYVKNNASVQNADTFWGSFLTIKNVYSIGDSLKNSIPSELYAEGARTRDIQIPGGYRGGLVASAYFDGSPQQVSFDVGALNSASTQNSFHFAIEHQGSTIVDEKILNIGRITQHSKVRVPASTPGFYTLRFTPSTEALVVSNIRFHGDAVTLSKSLFIDQSKSSVTLYSKCANLRVAPVHQLGLQNAISVNGKQVKLQEVKKPQEVQTKSGVNTLIFPHADVSIGNSCGFTLEPESALRTAYERIGNRISVIPQLTKESLQAADFLFDPVPLAVIVDKKHNTYTVEQTFDLHQLSAKGTKFIFSLGHPGLTTQPGAYLHIKNITFTAKRTPFSFSDIRKALKGFFKR